MCRDRVRLHSRHIQGGAGPQQPYPAVPTRFPGGKTSSLSRPPLTRPRIRRNADDRMDDALWERRHRLMYQAKLSAMYHQRRERRYDFWDRATKAVAAIGGLAAVTSLLSRGQIELVAASIAIVAVLSMVFDFSGRVRLHADYANRFRELQAELVSCGDDLRDPQCARLEAELVKAEKGEPRPLSGLVLLCQNDIAIAEGQPEKVQKLARWRRPFVHLFDMNLATSLPTVRATSGDK